MTQDNYDRLVKIVQFLLGGVAVVASFLLIQTEIVLDPIVKVVLGCVLTFAAYVNPQTLVRNKPAPSG